MTTTATHRAPGPAAGPARGAGHSPRRRRVAGASAGVVIAVVAAGGFGWGLHHDNEVGAAPFTDPAAAGTLTLCRDGKPVTSGSLDQLPDAIVGTQAAIGDVARTGGTASLFAYQPRQSIEPVSWSGLQLTGATVYADQATPTVLPEENATTLRQFLTGFPALDDGWIQLRLVLGAPGVQTQTTSYAAADLHVDGDTWQIADPGTAACPS